MCPTLSVRLPGQLKEGMEQLQDRVNWSEEIRQFIGKKIKEERKRALIWELEMQIAQISKAPRGTASRMIREDRDSH
jgi:hypothetical protein